MAGGASAVRWRRNQDAAFVERWSWAMGQPVHLAVFAESEQAGLDACAAALAELRRVETKLTLFDDASDLCELNRRAGRGSMRVDRDLGTALVLSEGFRTATGGAFNAAVEPLMRAWGFHYPRQNPPSPREIDEAREAVTTAVVEIDGSVVRLPQRHTRLDFGGIGVGYGVDRASAVLRSHGIRRGFVDVSGDCAAIGSPPGESGWRVAIADPRRRGQRLGTRRLTDAALATSANTASTLRFGSMVIGHVLDPDTGWPARALMQSSVVAASAASADALSTATLVSGKRPPGVCEVIALPTQS